MRQKAVLVIGSTGQTGQEMIAYARKNDLPVIPVARDEADLTDKESLRRVILAAKPGYVLNAAAYTAVDKAESEPEKAFAVNAGGVLNIAEICQEARVPLLHLSTDYVFDGQKTTAYTEEDFPAPLSIYGSSKLAGEEAVLSLDSQALILRTSGVYGIYGNNFFKTILKLATEREALSLVYDQVMTPTGSYTIARTVFALCAFFDRYGFQPDFRGIFHLSATGETNWFEFAEFFLKEATVYGRKMPALSRITAADWGAKAERPAYSCLNSRALQSIFKIKMPFWQDEAQQTLRHYLAS